MPASYCFWLNSNCPRNTQPRANLGSATTARCIDDTAPCRSWLVNSTLASASNRVASEESLPGSPLKEFITDSAFAGDVELGTDGSVTHVVCTYWAISFCIFLTKFR